MAKEPTGYGSGAASTGDKPKRKSGPRVQKEKLAFLLFKGTIESVEILFDPLKALDAKEADPSLTYRKIVLPMGKKRAPAAVEGSTATA